MLPDIADCAGFLPVLDASNRALLRSAKAPSVPASLPSCPIFFVIRFFKSSRSFSASVTVILLFIIIAPVCIVNSPSPYTSGIAAACFYSVIILFQIFTSVIQLQTD